MTKLLSIVPPAVLMFPANIGWMNGLPFAASAARQKNHDLKRPDEFSTGDHHRWIKRNI